MPDADRPIDDFDVWTRCQHDWVNGITYSSYEVEQTCSKCGATDIKDVS